MLSKKSCCECGTISLGTPFGGHDEWHDGLR